MTTADDDYNKFKFCFKDYDKIDEKAKLDDDLNKFYEGFIETNYLFIHKLLRDDNDNNVCKAKFFIITLAFLYYLKNKEKGNNKDKIQILKNKYHLTDDISSNIKVLYENIKPNDNKDVQVKPDKSSEDNKLFIFQINKLLIVIMKNIMIATKTNLDKIKHIYNQLN